MRTTPLMNSARYIKASDANPQNFQGFLYLNSHCKTEADRGQEEKYM